jgi:hypothetical protein
MTAAGMALHDQSFLTDEENGKQHALEVSSTSIKLRRSVSNIIELGYYYPRALEELEYAGLAIRGFGPADPTVELLAKDETTTGPELRLSKRTEDPERKRVTRVYAARD